ncbi:MAG: sigma-54-dependent Fis family transcriptional regulator [Deltaproteobacteria bacterium]|nr:sigma-54-dependent Fis family transcriptional regulator [Deltaproteobacteria bacterium]
MASETTSEAPNGGTSAQAAISPQAGVLVTCEVQGTDDPTSAVKAAANAAGLAVAKHIGALPRRAIAGKGSYQGIVGQSKPMLDLFRMLERIKGSSATVLVTGENGTGKELVAHAIHDLSNRAKKRFVATNCSAFNDNLLESELFGHRRGSFTGAVADKPGLFEVADGGTFFLDEVGDMSPALQVKLLRVRQEGVFMPVGATEQKKVDTRIIAATNRDLTAMVKDGTFREDLYYRLHVVALKVPALRDRRDDIPPLVAHFMARLAERDGRQKVLSHRYQQHLMAHGWPGNVRECENEIERLWVLSGDEGVIGEEHLTPTIRNGTRPGPGPRSSAGEQGGVGIVQISSRTLPEAVETLERAMILDGLKTAKGNKTRAAEALGISRRNLIRKVQAYGLDGAWNDKVKT